jgi:hypothetical protein
MKINLICRCGAEFRGEAELQDEPMLRESELNRLDTMYKQWVLVHSYCKENNTEGEALQQELQEEPLKCIEKEMSTEKCSAFVGSGICLGGQECGIYKE